MAGNFRETAGVYAELSHVPLDGYEIHMGDTALSGNAVWAADIRDQVSGASKQDGAICENAGGTYVHGLFERKETVQAFLQIAGKRKGVDVSQLKGVDCVEYKETQYVIQTNEMRKQLNMETSYQILERGTVAFEI